MRPVTNQAILEYLRDHEQEMSDLLAELVELESPTNDKPSLDKLAAFLAKELRDLGAEVEMLSQTEAGNHVLARWGEGGGGALILCHMDTVWDVGTVAERPVRIEDGRLYGPGSDDMKGGIVVGLWALRALRKLDLMPGEPISMLLNSDEETGSKTSRETIESEALRHRVVYVLEPAVPPHGALKTWRKGGGKYHVNVTGRAAHAGADPQKGINAIEEMAHQILAIQGFTDYEIGTTYNVGLVTGGTRSNVVPAEAQAEVDIRIMRGEDASRVEAKMQSLKPHLTGSKVSVSGEVSRPPMERTESIAALFAQAQTLARDMGFEVAEAGTGGGSDGNWTAALGVPTLDGMGAVGDGGHSVDEYAVLSALPERAALLAAMLRSE
jgi:glutamate carboxypeptidase